jgi:uncharacterized membrane protein YphA (DoxX/SURF4 family)
MVSSSKQFAEVSANKHSSTDYLDIRIVWLRVVVAGSFMLEMLLSWRLWMGPRTFPKIPLLDIFPKTSFYVDVSIFAILLCLLVVIMVHPKPRGFIYAFLLTVALLAVSDQISWLPFFYQFYFMLLVLGFFAWSHRHEGKKQQLALTTCRWIVASLYFYSGLQKVNMEFVSNIFPWFVEPITHLVPAAQPFLIVSGVFAPFLEMSIGVGLLVKGYRTYAVVLAWAMHVFILLMLGPLGHNWGKGVLPWNISMMLFVFLLFWNVPPLPSLAISIKDHVIQKSILALFVVMPIFSFFNLWDSYLSATLYSGNINSGYIWITEGLQKQLPNEVQTYVKHQGNKLYLNYFQWSYEELGVATVPETRIFKSIARHLCTYASQPSDVTLVVQGKPTWFRADKPATYTCATLGF